MIEKNGAVQSLYDQTSDKERKGTKFSILDSRCKLVIITKTPENLFFYKLIVASIVEVATKVVCMGWGWGGTLLLLHFFIFIIIINSMGGNPSFVALFNIVIAFLVIVLSLTLPLLSPSWGKSLNIHQGSHHQGAPTQLLIFMNISLLLLL